MSNRTYDFPLTHSVNVGTAQAAVNVPGMTAQLNRVKIIDAFGLVGATPAAVTLSLGDGTTAAAYGTITVAAGGTTNNAADVTLNLNQASFEIVDLERLVITNTTSPAGALTGFTSGGWLLLIIGRGNPPF